MLPNGCGVLCSGCMLLLLCANYLGAVGPASPPGSAGCCSWDQQVPLTQCEVPQPESSSLVTQLKMTQNHREILENSTYIIVLLHYQSCEVPLSPYCLLLSLFLRLAGLALCSEHQPNFVAGSVPPWIWEPPFARAPFCPPPNISARVVSSA